MNVLFYNGKILIKLYGNLKNLKILKEYVFKNLIFKYN
jgi:hypothetical protein